MSTLLLHTFRNYKHLDITFSQEGAMLFGENGSGKTNVLEAIYFIAVGRSQRGASKGKMIHSNYSDTYVKGTFINDTSKTSVSIGISRDKKIILKKNNQKLRLLSEIFNNANVVSFGPHDIQLVYGDPSERRKFMDISISQIDTTYLENLILYKKNLLNRNKLLHLKPNDASIDLYEEKIAEYGSYIVMSRMNFFQIISSVFTDYLNTITEKKIHGSVTYKPSIRYVDTDRENWKKKFYSSLGEHRKRDMLVGYTSIGPHRDDFSCMLNNYPIKSFGSHGQCRATAITLRLCSLFYFEKIQSEKIIILADDIFNELDRNKVVNIYPLLKNRGQLFVTSLSCNDTLFQDLPRYSIADNTICTL